MYLSWPKTNAQIAKELKITPILDKLLEYKRNWIQHVNRMPRNRLPSVMKHYSPTGRRNHGRPLKRLLDTWDRNGSTSGPAPWQIYDDDDDDDDLSTEKSSVSWQVGTESSIIICVYFWSRTAVAACVLGQTSVCNSLWPNQFPYLLYCHRHERLINEPAISTP